MAIFFYCEACMHRFNFVEANKLIFDNINDLARYMARNKDADAAPCPRCGELCGPCRKNTNT